jgi:hypothetical protein
MNVLQRRSERATRQEAPKPAMLFPGTQKGRYGKVAALSSL